MLQGEHSAILSTFIKLPFVIKIFVLSIFEWPFYTGFTVLEKCQANVQFQAYYRKLVFKGQSSFLHIWTKNDIFFEFIVVQGGMGLAIGEMWRPAANFNSMKPGRVAQSVTCLTADYRGQLDPGGSAVVEFLTRDRGVWGTSLAQEGLSVTS